MELAYRAIRYHSLHLAEPTWVADPQLIYKLNPAKPEFPQGFRGKAPSRTRKADVRIVCLGGSTTFGHGVNAEQAWPAVVERELRAKGVDAEVINAAVQGYGSRQLLLRYRRDIAMLQPDYVIVHEGWNRTGALVDPDGWVAWGFGIARPGQKPHRAVTNYLILHSLIVQKIITWVSIRRGLKADKSVGPFHMDPYQNVFVGDSTALVKEIQAHHQQPVLVLYPALYFPRMTPKELSIFEPMLRGHRRFQQDMLTELERKHAALRAIAQSTGTPLVDLQGAFSSFRGEERTALFIDEMHLTVRGNEEAGKVISSFLANLILHRKTSHMGAF